MPGIDTLLLLVTFEVVSLCIQVILCPSTDLSKTGPLIIPQLLGEWLTELCRWHPSSLYRFRDYACCPLTSNWNGHPVLAGSFTSGKNHSSSTSSVRLSWIFFSNITTSFMLYPICGHAVMSFGESQGVMVLLTMMSIPFGWGRKPAPGSPPDPAAHTKGGTANPSNLIPSSINRVVWTRLYGAQEL